MDEAKQLLADLVAGLDGACISAWQSTHHWQQQLDAAREWLASQVQPARVEAKEPVGEAGTMPGTSGFTIACFHADKVPVGTKLYTHAPVQPNDAAPELLEALTKIAAIEDKQFGHDWEEIEEARGIARAAITMLSTPKKEG